MYSDYLTESMLINFCKDRFSKYMLICNKAYFKDFGRRYRPDVVIPELKLILEFDGYIHYTNNDTVITDIERDNFSKSLGYNTIRIPYFVQLHENVIQNLFDEFIDDISGYNSYPHGFIDKNVYMPGNFSSLGLNRYRFEINKRFYFIKKEIQSSLMEKYTSGKHKFLTCFPDGFDHTESTLIECTFG